MLEVGWQCSNVTVKYSSYTVVVRMSMLAGTDRPMAHIKATVNIPQKWCELLIIEPRKTSKDNKLQHLPQRIH